MASSLAVEDSANLDRNAGEQERAACGIEAAPQSASDLDRGVEEGVFGSGHRSSSQQEDVNASNETGASKESNMEVTDARGETLAGAEAVEGSGVIIAIEEVEVGVSNRSSEKVDKDDKKIPHELDSGDYDSSQQIAGDTPCDIHEAQAVIEEECKRAIVDEPSVLVGVKVVPSSSGSDNIAESIDIQQKEKYSIDGCLRNSHEGTIQAAPEVVQDFIVQGSDARLDSCDQKMATNEDDGAIDETPEANDAPDIHKQQDMTEVKNFCSCLDDTVAVDSVDVGRRNGEHLENAVSGMGTSVFLECREVIRKSGEPYVSEGQIHAMEIQGTHVADVECETRYEKLEGDVALVQVNSKNVVEDISSIEENLCTEDISSIEENLCTDNRISCHNPGDHLDVTDQTQGSNLIGTVCHMMSGESETSVTLVGDETESLGKAGVSVKAHLEIGKIELTVNAQSRTEDNCSSWNGIMNQDAVEQFQAAAGISKDNNPNEGLVAECTDKMDVNHEALLMKLNQKDTLTMTGETEVGEQSMLVVGTNQNDLDVDNSLCRKASTHNILVGSERKLLNIDPSTEAYLSKKLDLGDKNISYKEDDSIETVSDVLVTTSENRDPLPADEDRIKSRDDAGPPEFSNFESKSSDMCPTDSNSMDKEYFVMEGLNLSVEISAPTDSELSGIQAVVSQDIESAEQTKSLEDVLVNPGYIDMDGERDPCTGSEKRSVKQKPGYKENDQHAHYYILPEEKHSFSISDLVWGKVKSHPWWPGQIFDPSYASELALKHQRKDSFLVAYFGDKTFAWCDESQLKPFELYFSQMEKQSSSDVFVNAIDDALEEVSRRTNLGMACFCSSEATSSLTCKKVENAGIREGSNSCVVDKSHIVSCFCPDRLVDYAKALALMPFRGADRFELAVAKAHLKSFYRSKGYYGLPFLQDSGGNNGSQTNIYQSANENVGKGSTHKISTPTDSKHGKYKSRGRGSHSNKQMTDSEMEMAPFELTDAEVACELTNGGQTETVAEIGGEPVSVYTGKSRKAPDSDSSDSDRRKRKKLDSLGDMEMKLPCPTVSSSFKVGECIRRVASQLAGSPSILRTNIEASHKNASKDDSVFDIFVSDASHDSAIHNLKMMMAAPEDYSPDQILAQLCTAAVDPMMGFKPVGTQLTFFTNFRNYCVVSSTEQRLPEKSRRGRKRKVETRLITSSMLITDHMQDSYWSDLASCQSPVNGLATGRSQRRKRRPSGQTSSSPSSIPVLQNAECRQVGSPNMKLSMIVERSIINVEEKMVDECSPTALILNFNRLKPVPSETDLTRIFSRYGPLKEATTEVHKKNICVKVVFKRCADAEIAFSSTGKYSIFGPSLLSFRLSYLPLNPCSSPNTELQESDAMTFEDVSFQTLDTCETTYMSLDAKSEDESNTPIVSNNHETVYTCSIACTSSDSKSEDKHDAVPVQDTKFETSDSRQDACASSDTELQDKNDVVPMEVSSLEIMDSCRSAYTSPDASSQDKGDAVLMEDNNFETPDICRGNVSPDTKSQDKDDPVPLEDRNLEFPDSSQAACVYHDTKWQDKNNAVPMEDNNIVTLDICQGDGSTDIKSQDKNHRVPLEGGNIEIPEDPSLQDKNDAVPMEDISLETPDPCQGNTSTDSLDKNDLVPLQDSNLEISDSFQAASQDAKLQDKNDAVPLVDSNLKTPDTCQGDVSPDTKSQDTDDTVPMEDRNREILNSRQIAYVSPDSKSQDENNAVPLDDGNLETSHICLDSDGKNDPVSFEDGNHTPERCQIALVSPDVKSDKDDASTFENRSLQVPDDYQTTCTPSDTRLHDKNDGVPTENVNLENPDNCKVACTSPDAKPEDKLDTLPINCSSNETAEDCQTPDTVTRKIKCSTFQA